MDWEAAVQQLIQNQQNFGQAFAQFLTHQANAGPAGALPAKKIDVSPEAYDGSPQKFHEWWSNVKIWIATTHATTTDQQKAVAVYLRLEGPCAGRFAQVHLDEQQQGVGKVPTPASLSGPCQRINDFLAQFQALKLQSECPNEYAKDLLERAVSRRILEQVYMQGHARETWEQVTAAVQTVGRAQELFLINTASLTQYFSTNNYPSSSGTPSGSSAPMDIGVTNTHPPCGRGIQCYNCQGFGHISCKCTQPQRAQQQSPQQGRAVQPQVDRHNDDERVKASDDETGIIALESELDAVLCVLDYRLSRTMDYIACTIYEYRISLLRRKIEKTHKKFATSVPSPVSVPPNKYTSLVVEDVVTQCTMDSAGVPRSGPAPDIKRGVLNSRVSINGQNSPPLTSSDSESPADDLEVGFPVELR
ncbi:hypothetical protein SCLCIDRAFT_20495 [Scleroderma citrinum Foug A]|uniref:CCHC-type domain-containing protein n=1 Tax=Scleroderma citrinum Foug A TaxID=1036808 RepID=A0A0C3ASW2_9AGAM|nr:hypothetical protein SCLCIDRAFT_20495 [Scleroderma citrinum Foug A]